MPPKALSKHSDSGIYMCTYSLELFRQKYRISASKASEIFEKHGVYDFMLTFGHLEQTYDDDEILHNVEEVIRKNKSLKPCHD